MVGLTNKEKKELKNVFDLFDTDSDGKITIKEISKVVNQLKMEVSETDIAQMVQEADLDGDGAISFEEFILLVFHNKQTQHDNTLRVAFDTFDKNHDGFIDRDELRDVMSRYGEKISEKDLDRMIKEADSDGDERINFEEFYRMMKM